MQGDFLESAFFCPIEEKTVVEPGEFIFALEDAVETSAGEEGVVDGLFDEIARLQLAGDRLSVVAELEGRINTGVDGE